MHIAEPSTWMDIGYAMLMVRTHADAAATALYDQLILLQVQLGIS